MSNEYYDHGSYPATGSSLSSASMRAELESIETGFDKLPTLTGNANELVVVNPSGTALTTIPAGESSASTIHAATSKATPVDADEIPLSDSEASWGLKKLTWANLKAGIKSYYDSVTATLSNKTLADPVYTGTLTGGTGVVNLGSGQFYKDASGNVGVGTASPAGRLHSEVSGAEALVFGSSARKLYGRADSGGVSLFTGASQTGTGWYFDAANNKLIAYTNSAAVGQFDASGNLGLGVTPSAWGNGRLAMDILSFGAGLVSSPGGNTDTNLSHNAYHNGTNWIYKSSSVSAGRYQIEGGAGGSVHSWHVSQPGTAGNAISFTTAMTLDDSGNMSVPGKVQGGATAPGTVDMAMFSGTNAIANDLTLYGPSTSQVRVRFSRLGGSGIGEIGYDMATDTMWIITGGSGRVAVDGNGNLLVGTTSALGRVASKSGSGFTSNSFRSDSDTAGNTTWTHFYGTSSGATVANIAIFGNGNVQNLNNSYGAISDLKLKDNITDASPKLAKLMQVRIVNYTLKSDPDKTKLIGVIAQELEQISPGLIEETPDYEEVTKTREVEVPAVEAVLDDEGNEVTPAVPASTKTEEYTERVPTGTTTKAVKYSVFVPMLIKGMQEQQAQIATMQSQLDAQNEAMQLLAARLAALEAK